jgi:Xaa-Pro aminopeptidase
MNPYSEKLAILRTLMKNSGIDIYLIPSADPHLSEYIPDHWKIIPWLTGFTGSSATVFVSEEFAGLWTDSRYFIQAELQLKDSGFILINSVAENTDFTDWLSGIVHQGDKLALDGRIFSIERIRKIERSLGQNQISFNTGIDLISQLWTDRPPLPMSPAFEHEVKYCGKERSAKIAEVRAQMKIRSIDYHLLTSLDDLMWLLNIRGNDIKFSPLLIAFAVIDDEQILLFIEESKIPLRMAMEFDKLGIIMLPYEETSGMLSTLDPECSILINPATTSSAVFDSLPAGITIVEDISIPTRLKAVKNKTEIENIGKAMIRDGVALTRFFCWLEMNLPDISLSEFSTGEKLDGFRAEGENFLGPSFSTIVAFNENAALPHYSAIAGSDKTISGDGILLIDSGGQYLDGTTDITRTIPLGRPSSQQKRDFTRVLKGNINLAMAKFPEGTRGNQLDILARKSLWESGLNYGHGTGHGVGFCLNVHEGPQNIGQGTVYDLKNVIAPGMLMSDEPAIYREGEYGIRIENLILCYEDEETEFGKFLRFDTLSLCYIEKSLIDISLLDRKEIDWLNNYHAEVFGKLSPWLTEQEKTWLKEKTSAILY